MKRLPILLALLIAGCGITVQDVQMAETICKDHGGLKNAWMDSSGGVNIYCRDHTELSGVKP